MPSTGTGYISNSTGTRLDGKPPNYHTISQLKCSNRLLPDERHDRAITKRMPGVKCSGSVMFDSRLKAN